MSNLYPKAKNVRFNRTDFELIDRFKHVCMQMGANLATNHDFLNSLRYKRLFFLRREFEILILDKLYFASLQ